jgi:hypothetical protein
MQIFIQAAKMEEEILYLSKITKNDSKIIFLIYANNSEDF